MLAKLLIGALFLSSVTTAVAQPATSRGNGVFNWEDRERDRKKIEEPASFYGEVMVRNSTDKHAVVVRLDPTMAQDNSRHWFVLQVEVAPAVDFQSHAATV